MRVIQRPYAAGGRVAALGTFDGVHIGHKALLNTAKSVATGYAVPLRVCTFNRHPLDVIRPGSSPDQLSTIPEKAMLMAGLGVDEMELMNFDRTMAAMEPADFLERLRKSMKLRAVVAGWNYTFGRNGSGDADMLRADGQLHGYDVIIVPPVRMDNGTVISSSLARQKLREGNMECTAELLGYSYTLTGTVSQGKHKGHELGFPTANIEPWHRKALPHYGVYTCLLETGTEILPAVVNIGNQPTMPSGKVTVEVHALFGTPELYGQKVRASLMQMLREEKKFDSAEQLKEQIRYDCHEALKYFDMA
jgi:riboflavin kinase/FMN adenylyltransferase